MTINLHNSDTSFIGNLVGRPSTIKTQTSLFTNHIHPYLPKELGDGNQLLVHLYSKWEEADLSPGTKRSLVSLFKRFYEWETGQKLDTERTRRIQRYLSRLEQPKHATLKVWTRDHCRTALNAARHLDKKLHLMLLISLHTGIRRGELFGLKWGDVDFVRGELIVQRSYDGPTKSGKPRSIPLSQELERELQNGYTVGREDDYIFHWTDPNPKLAALCRNAGVPEITWHGLRHTFATLALESGLIPTQVQDMMGHAKLSTLLDTYWQFFGNKPDMEFVP